MTIKGKGRDTIATPVTCKSQMTSLGTADNIFLAKYYLRKNQTLGIALGTEGVHAEVQNDARQGEQGVNALGKSGHYVM